jgi:hypothetical protein
VREPMIDYSKSEEMEGEHKQNEYVKNQKQTLSAERTEIGHMSKEEIRRKYETITGHLA